jgi:hypothetical protein
MVPKDANKGRNEAARDKRGKTSLTSLEQLSMEPAVKIEEELQGWLLDQSLCFTRAALLLAGLR